MQLIIICSVLIIVLIPIQKLESQEFNYVHRILPNSKSVLTLTIRQNSLVYMNDLYRIYKPNSNILLRTIEISPYKKDLSTGLPIVVDPMGVNKMFILSNDEIASAYMKVSVYENAPGTIMPIFIGFEESVINSINMYGLSAESTNVSSSLIEGNYEYGVKNLIGQSTLDEPWVEGVPGNGIGEYVEFNLESEAEAEVGTFNSVYFYNGFISFEKPHLYHENSRVKTITVTDLTANESWEVFIEDTPNPQIIEIPGGEHHRIRLVIKAVYQGSKYEDTCIAAIKLRGFYGESTE